MPSGIIQAQPDERKVTRRQQELTLWERGSPVPPDLPWMDGSQVDSIDLGRLVGSAQTLAMVVGSTQTSRALLNEVLAKVQPSTRLYVYGDRALESDQKLVQRLEGLADRVLFRLGHRPPADWLIADAGRDGRLFVGTDAAERRWMIPTDGPLGRSLFEAFRHLYWFHASREALPDRAGTVAFRTPLLTPFDNPGDDLTLPSGRLAMGTALPDPIPDAEIRYSPVRVDPGRGGIIFIPPAEEMQNGASAGPISLDLPRSLAGRGHRVVWSDLGLPRLAVTRQRFVMDLVEAPIGLQLEWPRSSAVDLFHRFERICGNPEWAFHPTRKLGSIRNGVLLEGATREASAQASVTVDVGQVVAPLEDFENTKPGTFPTAPPLALEVVYKWTRVPETLPGGARPAQIVRAWTAVDEWASRAVDDCRETLTRLEDQEGFLGRLRRWLPSRDEARLEKRRLRDEIDVLGEARPSQTPELAVESLRRIRSVADRLNTLLRDTHDSRQAAEDASAEEEQRSAWQERVSAARSTLAEVRRKIAENETAQEQATEEIGAAEAVLDEAITALRSKRAAELNAGREPLLAELEDARAAQQELKEAHDGRPPKGARKEAARRRHKAEQALAQHDRDAESLDSWTPPASATQEETSLVAEAKRVLAGLKAEAKVLASEARASENAAGEEFRFSPPARLVLPASMSLSDPPSVPSEAPPELGDLFEFQGQRHLAIKTWEQLRRAVPVARRLGAVLVVAPPASK